MGNLRPLNQILPQQPVQQQPVYQQPQQPVYQQPAPQQPVYQQPASGELQISRLTDSSQLATMANNGRVEVVIEDRTHGHLVLSSDKINIGQIEARNMGLGQELRMFDQNRDGWLEEHELKTSAVTSSGGEVSTGEHVASTTIGGAMFGLAVGTVARKVGWDVAGKIGAKLGVKGWIAAAGIGAAAGLAGGLLTKNSNKGADAQVPQNGYGQWHQERLAKSVL